MITGVAVQYLAAQFPRARAEARIASVNDAPGEFQTDQLYYLAILESEVMYIKSG